RDAGRQLPTGQRDRLGVVPAADRLAHRRQRIKADPRVGARILNTKDEAAAAAPKARISVDYEIGDAVKVLDGPFASFNGVVEELDFEKSRVKVSVSI